MDIDLLVLVIERRVNRTRQLCYLLLACDGIVFLQDADIFLKLFVVPSLSQANTTDASLKSTATYSVPPFFGQTATRPQ